MALPAQDGKDGKDGAPFSGTFTSPNGQYSLSVTDTGIVLASPDSSIKVSATEIRVESMGTDTIEVRGGAKSTSRAGRVSCSGAAARLRWRPARD